MTEVMSTGPTSATSPPPDTTSPNSSHPPLPPLITSPTPATARTNLARPMSHASKNRLSQYSTGSVPSRSRPASYLFPIFHSSLSYTIVRDFAYNPMNPMHYGPPPEPSGPPSGMTTPLSESKRFSDPPAGWENKMGWEWTSDGLGKHGDLAPIHFGDGPPWSEDEDLQSPVVSSRHKKHKSTSATMGPKFHPSQNVGATILQPDFYGQPRAYYVGSGGDGSERYYMNQGGEANGPGGEYVTYPQNQARHPSNAYHPVDQQPRQYAENDANYRSESDSSATSSPAFRNFDQSRYSRDYQFTITSPDEEMHGKAVALFDFERENENELPLVEGQIIWVSYRHGEGWLVAEDPKTQESGLVPEEYVRLLRDIEGGMNSLTGQVSDGAGTPNEAGTPTQAEHSGTLSPTTLAPTTLAPTTLAPTAHTPTTLAPTTLGQPVSGHSPHSSNASNGYNQPVVSTFSTSSKDLEPYPPHMLGTQSGQPPPQVVHYQGQRGGSQAGTPTVQNTFDNGIGQRGSQDSKRSNSVSAKNKALEMLTGAKMSPQSNEPETAEDGTKR